MRLPPRTDKIADDIGRQLLWHAARSVQSLRRGAPLLAQPSTHQDCVALMDSLGFAPTGLAPAEADGEPLLALVTRRDPSEPCDGSHVALRCSNIEQSIDFWSLLHFSVVRAFTTEGARAAWLSAPWSSLSLELIEIPPLMQCSSSPAADADGVGLAHVCLDVTPIGVGLQPTLALLQQRSTARFDRTVRVLEPPQQQMMGALVVEVAVLRAPDGVQLEVLHRTGSLSKPMEPDWM